MRACQSTAIDPVGNIVVRAYDVLGPLESVTDALAGVTTFEYDAAGNRTKKTDGKGQVTQYAYDSARRLLTTTYDDATTATFTYDARGSRLTESNVDSNRTRTYDALGRLATVLDVETGRTITYGYDANGMRTSMHVMPDDETTTYEWDGRGKLTKMTDPDGDDYYFAYDAAGRRIVQTYPNGMALTQAYDAVGQVLAMVYQHPNGSVLQSFGYTYDPRGNRQWKMFETGGAEQYEYDALSRLTRAIYPSGRDVTYTYDPVGNRLAMTERQLTVPDPCNDDVDCDGVLDADDNCPNYVNPGQEDSDTTAINLHGGLGVWPFEGTGTTVDDQLDAFDGTMVGAVTRTTNGKFGSAIDIASGGTVTFGAGAVDGLGAFTISGWVKTTDTDATIFQASNATETDELRIRTVTPTGAARVDVKGSGFLLGGATIVDGAWHHIAITRNDLGEMQWWLDGDAATTGAGSALLLEADTVTLGSASNGFDGSLDEWAIYPRVLEEEEIDRLYAQGLLGDGVGDHCDPCPLEGDPACEATQCLDADGDGYGVIGFTACPKGGVVDCDDTDPVVHPGVSAACQVRVPVDVESVTYTYNDFNQLVNSTSDVGGLTQYAFDANGNQLSKDVTTSQSGTTSYTWDARDRLTQLTAPDGTTNQFGYDTENLRVRVQDSSGDRRVLLDGVEESAEYDTTGQTEVARYDHDPSDVDRLLAQETPADGKQQFATDALGSVYGLADDEAEVVSEYDYDVYGAQEVVSEGVETRSGFTGRTAAGDVDGSWYVRARYLDSGAGGFVSEDPFNLRVLLGRQLQGQAGQSDYGAWSSRATLLNRYQYVGATPATSRDPLGLFPYVAPFLWSLLVPRHRDFDRLAGGRSIGRSSGGTSSRRLRDRPGTLASRPRFSSSSTMRWTDGGVTPKNFCMSA